MDAGEKRAARGAAKKFGSNEPRGAGAVDQDVAGVQVRVVESTAGRRSRAMRRMRRRDAKIRRGILDDVFATCVVATYHAQDVVSAAMKAGAKNIDRVRALTPPIVESTRG